MKAGEIIDAAIEGSKCPIVIEMPDGKQITSTGYYHSSDKRGDPVIVIIAGKRKG